MSYLTDADKKAIEILRSFHYWNLAQEQAISLAIKSIRYRARHIARKSKK